ncbi:MAG: 16S rRNA (uracil(1498)-N(3))-methyltransferase [Actinomycetota bacterium]
MNLSAHTLHRFFCLLRSSPRRFSVGEIDDLLSLGAKMVTLGRQILRAETAAIATLTVVLYHFDRLGG